ncbi:SGNH/GDSL hydrolase family protein [Novosphingobium umbonatum]|uniref:SGNH/GDSL hydrolase family protein n=1 Tax=Novosphingobium umbonatum TaxID=1908524 RepID=A0A437N6W1_9SPHN|nr:SGNH/GDSL hydrolase family protein [Novosphingobium umbonatum]RVU05654.1 SGNH/GDSL hydrolase family protein [Novosphingobium umbonatum]
MKQGMLAALAAGLIAVGPQAWAKPQAEGGCKAQWVAAWGSAQFQPDANNALPAGSFAGKTLREILRLSLGGQKVRLRLSNFAGTQPLTLKGVSVALAQDPAHAAVDPLSIRPVRFDGRQEVTIPAGADYWSDAVDLPMQAGRDLAVSIAYDADPANQTSHPGSRATSYLLAGDQREAADMPGASTTDHWFQLAGVEVERCAPAAVIVALGDSITDGHGTTTNGNNRWTDILAQRLQADPRFRNQAVINQGIGGNRLLHDGLGPNALARFERDVLSQAGLSHVIVLEGINDIGTLTREAPVPLAEHQRLVANMIAAYRQIIARAHARGVKVIGATIMPFMGTAFYHPDAQNEADRQNVNDWIRAKGHFDAVIDFDAITRDPAHPDRLLPTYDKGDFLHPGPQGYRAMGEAIDLTLFR